MQGASPGNRVWLTFRDRNFIPSSSPGLEEPGQGSGREKGL